MKGAFSTPVCARKQTNGPPITDQGFSTGSCNRHHALSGRAVDKSVIVVLYNRVLTAHTEWLPGVATEAFQSHLCSTYRGLWGLVVVRLS